MLLSLIPSFKCVCVCVCVCVCACVCACACACACACVRVVQIYWFKDGKQISKRSEHYRISREADGTCSLHTAAALLDDDGNYTIMAANPQVPQAKHPEI